MRVYLKGLNACMMRKFNLFDYATHFTRAGHEIVSTPDEADLLLVWSCSFRKDIYEKSLEIIRELTEVYGEKVFVCGCLPSIDPDGLQEVFSGRSGEWKREDEWLPGLLGLNESKYARPERSTLSEAPLPDSRRRSYHDQFGKLYISEGCRGSCTYCAEQLAFPAFRSFPEDAILAEADKLVNEGVQQIVLFADDVGDYGTDTGDTSFAMLCNRLIDHCHLDEGALGWSAISPRRFLSDQDALLEIVDSKRVFHISLPIQSASEKILKLMNRECSMESVSNLFSELERRPWVEVETHFICGFPGETEDDFLLSLDFLKQHTFKWVQISGYSDFHALPSFSLPGKVDTECVRRRVLSMVKVLEDNNTFYDYEVPEKLSYLDD